MPIVLLANWIFITIECNSALHCVNFKCANQINLVPTVGIETPPFWNPIAFQLSQLQLCGTWSLRNFHNWHHWLQWLQLVIIGLPFFYRENWKALIFHQLLTSYLSSNKVETLMLNTNLLSTLNFKLLLNFIWQLQIIFGQNGSDLTHFYISQVLENASYSSRKLKLQNFYPLRDLALYLASCFS